jgi:hypothetical protein
MSTITFRSDPKNTHQWFNSIVADRWGSDVKEVEVTRPSMSAADEEILRFAGNWPHVSARLNLTFNPPIQRLFDPGKVLRSDARFHRDAAHFPDLIKRYVFMGDWGEVGSYNWQPPTDEDVVLCGTGQLSVERENHIAIAFGQGMIRAQYVLPRNIGPDVVVEVVTVRLPDPRTLVFVY